MEFNYIIIFICIALITFLIFKEVKRSDRARLIWRLLASVLMVSCFALLIIPISYSVKKQQSAGVLNLLTEGTSLDTILAIKDSKYDLDSTFFPVNKGLRIRHLADLGYYLKENLAVKKINVYGYGLDENELKTLKDYQISFHPSKVPSGIISASWQKKLRASENLKVQGIYRNANNETVKLKLYGLGASLDSANVKSGEELHFSFSNRPKQVGKAVYNLIALQGNDTLSVGPVPFEVEKKEPINVLILASFPDFEYKFLKKWLYENQYAVALRSQISKDKYSTDFLNMKAVNVDQLNQALLKNMDLVMIDEDELAAISAADRSSIYNAVNNGMGLIIRVTNPKSNGQNFGQYEFVAPVEKPLSLKSADHLKFSDISFKQTIFLKTAANNQPLIFDETGKILANLQLNGMGRVLTTSFSSSYQWQLAGKITDYGRFWSLLFDKSLRKKIESQSFKILPQFAAVNEKSRLFVSVADQKAPMISIDSVNINPRQNMEMPFEWDGFYWAKKNGWHSLSINKKIEDVYFYKNEDWKSAKNFAKLNATANFVANQSHSVIDNGKIEYLAKETINKWWFFVGFLLSVSFLWYEQRFLVKQ